MSGVKQFKEVSRERYVTDEEYNAVYEFGADVVRAAMEIAYLCVAAELCPVFKLRANQRNGDIYPPVKLA